MHYYYYKYFVLLTSHSPWKPIADYRLPMTIQYFIFEKLNELQENCERRKKGHDYRFSTETLHGKSEYQQSNQYAIEIGDDDKALENGDENE